MNFDVSPNKFGFHMSADFFIYGWLLYSNPDGMGEGHMVLTCHLLAYSGHGNGRGRSCEPSSPGGVDHATHHTLLA